MALEEVQTHSIIYESLAMAEKAQRVMQKDYESYSDLFAKIDDNKSVQEEVSSFMASKAFDQGEEEALLQELENLEVAQAENQLENSALNARLAKQREEEQVGLLERELESLSIASTTHEERKEQLAL
jgi:hypothetical protein